MANVFRSKEVYKHLKHDVYGKNTIVPVKGVYISGEYRPPYYNESGIRIYEINSKHAKVESFQDISTSNGEDYILKIVDFSVDVYKIAPINYSTATADAGEDGMVKILDFYCEPLQPELYWYESQDQNAGEDGMVKILDFYCDAISISQPITYLTERNESTPEPMLRLSSITSENAIIENYT